MSLDKIKNSNKKFIIGADEVGTGSLAGPLIVCGVKAAKDWNLEGLNDSKKLSEKKRNIMLIKLMHLVKSGEIQYHMVSKSNSEIDTFGLAAALKASYIEIFKKLYCDNSSLVADGNLKFDFKIYDVISLPKADTLIPTVMAGSIIAKVSRDEEMRLLHIKHPEYEWNKNVGYPSKVHKIALNEYGATPFHRRSYKPVAAAIKYVGSICWEEDRRIIAELYAIANGNKFI